MRAVRQHYPWNPRFPFPKKFQSNELGQLDTGSMIHTEQLKPLFARSWRGVRHHKYIRDISSTPDPIQPGGVDNAFNN